MSSLARIRRPGDMIPAHRPRRPLVRSTVRVNSGQAAGSTDFGLENAGEVSRIFLPGVRSLRSLMLVRFLRLLGMWSDVCPARHAAFEVPDSLAYPR